MTVHDPEWGQRIRSAVRERVGTASPLVVLDLDLTLVDNTPRTRQILAQFLLARPMPASERERALEAAWTGPIRFSIVENLKTLGVSADDGVEQGVAFWRERFFSDDFCRYDVPYAGAVEACRALWGLGATLVYFTARPQAEMGRGTVDFLIRYGFPVLGPRALLVMKDDPEQSDSTFKAAAAAEVARWGRVVGAVDNEPGHCNAWQTAFDGAAVAWVRTRHSPGAPALESGIAVVDHLWNLV